MMMTKAAAIIINDHDQDGVNVFVFVVLLLLMILQTCFYNYMICNSIVERYSTVVNCWFSVFGA